jgi:glycosyltransferase involved in cell wall biosynthesis
MTDVSIVVPSRGGAARLPVLLDSLARQTRQDFEVVVVLDGDVDDSASVLDARTDLPVRTVVFPENRGRSAALNAGFEAAAGQVLVRCDDDLELPPSYVADRIDLHAGTSQGVVGLCRNIYPPTAYARVYGEPMDVVSRAAAYSTPAELTWRHWGANVSVTRDDYQRVGDYDVGFTRYGWEDVDWGYRLHRLGNPIVVRPELEAGHHVAATTTSVRALRAYLSGRSQVRFERKHGFCVFAHDAPPHGPWLRAVDLASRGLDEKRVAVRGERIEAALDRLPRYVARKAVALMVESAARAGYRQAKTDDTEGTPTCPPH